MDERPMLARTFGGKPEDEALQDLALSELVSRVLDRGVVVSGEVIISVAGVDLVYLGLDLLLTSVESARQRREPPGREGPPPEGSGGTGGVGGPGEPGAPGASG